MIIVKFVKLIIGISGCVLEKPNITRILSFLVSVAFLYCIKTYYPNQVFFGLVYFLLFAFLYNFFVFYVLSENGARLNWIKSLGEDKAYYQYQTILGLIFYHNAASISYMSEIKEYAIFSNLELFYAKIAAVLLIAIGLVVKIWSAYIVGMDIYYWKDMFLGRKICAFVEQGPYKYLANPMYGVGQLQGYGLAIYFNSWLGILACFLNQFLVFMFYFLAEKKFIYKTYLQ